MGNDSHKISRGVRLFVAFVVLGSIGLQGCQDWPDERVTAIEAQNILRELSEIDGVEEPNIPIPAVYKLPPRKVRHMVGGAEEWRLFYFAKYHTAEKLRQLIDEQFSNRVFDKQGKDKVVPNFGVTANPETNQLIVRALTEDDIDAILEVIESADVPPIQVQIDCMVSELYADLTMDRETTLLIENLFGEGVTLGGKVDSSGNLLPAFPGAALRDPAREKFGLKIGISRGEEGHRFQALVDLLVSRGYLKILMNPSLQVVNGQTAHIQAKEHVPLQQIFLKGGYGDTSFIETRTEYYDIIDELMITPHVFADGYIGLETDAQIAAYLTPEGIKQLPIVTERTITNKDNRIRHGESLVIGGIRKTEKRDVVRGVPILKDIPLLNLLFSGRDFEERAKEVIFIITPTVSTGGTPNEEMMEMLRERHASPMTQNLQEKVMDPLGLRARDEDRLRELEKARSAQKASDAEKTAARLEAMEREQQVQDLEAELDQARTEIEQANTRAEQATQQAEEAKAEAQKAKAEAEKARETPNPSPPKPQGGQPPAEGAKEQAPPQGQAQPDQPAEQKKEPGQ